MVRKIFCAKLQCIEHRAEERLIQNIKKKQVGVVILQQRQFIRFIFGRMLENLETGSDGEY